MVQTKSWMPRGGIRRRLMIWGVALLGVALVLNTVVGSIYTRRQIKAASAQLQFEIATATSRHIQTFIARKIDRLQDTAVALSLYPLGSESQRLLIQLLVKNDSSFTDISLLDPHGKEVLRFSERSVYLGSDLRNEAASAAFIHASQGRVYLSPVRTSNRAEPYLNVALPVKLGPHRIAGVVKAQTDLKFLWQAVGEARFGNGGYIFLVDETGLLIAHPDPSVALKHQSLHSLSKVRRFLSTRAPDKSPGEESEGINRTPVLSTYAPVPELGWAVVVEQPVDLALAPVKQLQQFAILVIGVGLLVSAGTMVWVSGKITRPIDELRRDVETIGSGKLEHRADIKTGDEIEELAIEFNKMTAALQNSHATLEQKVIQRTQESSALYEVIAALNESLALQSILDAVITKITEIFHFEATRIFLFNDVDELELRASFEATPEHWTGVRFFKRGQGVIGRVADVGEPMIFEDIMKDPRYAALSSSKVTQKARLRFLAVFPIKTKSRVFGAILFNGRSPRKLTGDEARLLTSLSAHLAVAVEKADLFQQSETRSRQLAVLNMIGAAVGQSLNLESILKDAIEKLVATLNFDGAWIYMLDPVTQELRIKAFKGLPEETARSMDRRGLSAGITGKIFETGERLVFENFQTDEQYQKLSSHSMMRGLGFGSGMGIPIAANDKIIGVLHLANREPRRYARDELQLIESISRAIGVAAENARLFEQVNQKTSELAQMNQNLEQANRAKTEFISAMSHELRTPLNVIMGNAELTRDGFFGEINAEQKKSMTQIYHHSEFLLKMVNDVLALSRLDAKKITLELATVDIQEVIANVQSQAEHLSRRNSLVEVCWDVEPGLPPIVTDATKLEEILQNLIGNAFKFTPGGRIEVRVRNVCVQDRIEFTVSDTGIGIEADDIERIFGAFEQIKEAHTGNFSGVGLGLNIVAKYLELMDGDIHVESQPGRGSRFTFTLPRTLPLAS